MDDERLGLELASVCQSLMCLIAGEGDAGVADLGGNEGRSRRLGLGRGRGRGVSWDGRIAMASWENPCVLFSCGTEKGGSMMGCPGGLH